MDKNKENKRAKIIPFERDGEFFLRRGSLRLEKNDLWDAAYNYRMACKREPENTEYRLALAQVLTEMHRYEQSNQLILPLLGVKGHPTECYFGMACNFIGMLEFGRARESLQNYLEIDPEGYYCYDALDMLDAIEGGDYGLFMDDVPTEEERRAQEACSRCRKYMEDGNVSKALALMKETAKRYPALAFVQNNLAMAYFCKKQFDDAIRIARAVLEADPKNIQAYCNLAIFAKASGDMKQVEEAVSKLKKCTSKDPDDLNRMGVTFLEMGEYEQAKRVMKSLLMIVPYDEGALHRMGVCCYRLGEYKKARACYDRLLKIEPEDSIALYYRGLCQKAIAGKPVQMEWMHNYQVPYEEVIRRIRMINGYTKLDQSEIDRLWMESSRFRALLQWGLRLPEPLAKQALLLMIANIGGESAEQIIRAFALDPEQPDEIKKEGLLLLKRMGAKEPYLAMIDGNLVQSRAGLFCHLPENLPGMYQEVIKIMLESMADTRSPECLELAAKRFEAYVEGLKGQYPRLTRPQVYAMAAALEFLSCKETGERNAGKAQIASLYGVSLLRLNNAIGKLLRDGDEN